MNIDCSNILIALPHLDDEFAFAPLIKKITNDKKYNIMVLYCAERRKYSLDLQLKRRKESVAALNFLGINRKDIIYINNSEYVDDKKLYISSIKVYTFLNKIYRKFKFEMIMTLSLEGGHPDHDALSLIIEKFRIKNGIKAMYFPAYNARKSLFFIPYSVLRPLESQTYMYKIIGIDSFSWFTAIKIAFIYKSEYKAFLKLFPFFVFKFLFSKDLFYSDFIDKHSINWQHSLTYLKYGVKSDDLFHYIRKI